MHRFRVENLPAIGEVVRLDARDEAHLFRTLRALPGEEIGLFDGNGGVASARVADAKQLILIRKDQIAPPDVKLYLCSAVPRKNKLDQLLPQMAETGVWQWCPMICERSVAQPDEPSSRWQLQLIEGAKQSGNAFVPKVAAPEKFSKVLADMTTLCDIVIYGKVNDALQQKQLPRQGAIAFFVGPEGGFSPEEEMALEQAGAVGMCMGNHILRLETAAAAGSLLLLYLASARSGNE